jgi:hypothetical protein
MKNRTVYCAIFCISILFFPNALKAQDTQEVKTLFGNQNPFNSKDLGYFASAAYGLTSIDGSSASLLQVRAGIDWKKTISFGAYATTSLNQIKPDSETISSVYMDYWSAGGFIEYTIMSNNIIHLTLPVFLGYGEVEMDNEIGNAGFGEENFFQIEPTALLEVNLHKHVRLNVGSGYRLVSNMNYRNLNQSDLSGFTGYIGFKVGLF